MNTKIETTYRDDYNFPQVKYFPTPRISFTMPQHTNLENCVCDPVTENPKTSQVSYEWSRLGPMGFLLEPKLYAVNADLELCTGDFVKCGDVKNYMEIFEGRSGSKQPTSISYDILRRIQEDRLKTTYQVDYDHLVEYPVLSYDEEIRLKAEKPEITCREPVKLPWIGGHDIPGRPKRSPGFDTSVKASATGKVSGQRIESRSKDVPVKGQKVIISDVPQTGEKDDQGIVKEAVLEQNASGKIERNVEEKTLEDTRVASEGTIIQKGEMLDQTKVQDERPIYDERKIVDKEIVGNEQNIVKEPKKPKKHLKITPIIQVKIHKKPVEPRNSEYYDVHNFTANEIIKNKLHCTSKKCKEQKIGPKMA